MSRADSKTQLQSKIAQVQKDIDWNTNVNGDYNMVETTNPYSSRVDYTGIDGYKGWLIQWQSDNSGVSYDADFSFTDTEWDSKSDDERNQFFSHAHKEIVTDGTVPNIDSFNTEKATLQADLDDLIAGEEAGDVDQVSG
tara:strand:+ start:273 stop:689 length:417 start_codon:yes stop_codon:yes gene_type:complete